MHQHQLTRERASTSSIGGERAGGTCCAHLSKVVVPLAGVCIVSIPWATKGGVRSCACQMPTQCSGIPELCRSHILKDGDAAVGCGTTTEGCSGQPPLLGSAGSSKAGRASSTHAHVEGLYTHTAMLRSFLVTDGL